MFRTFTFSLLTYVSENWRNFMHAFIYKIVFRQNECKSVAQFMIGKGVGEIVVVVVSPFF